MTTDVRIGRSFPLPPGITGTAYFSPDHAYRFLLTRSWHDRKLALTSIGMNPSSAGMDRDDGTIRILERLAIAQGYGALRMLNSDPLVSTDSGALDRPPDAAAAAENDRVIMNNLRTADAILCCWGVINRTRHLDLQAMVFRHCGGAPIYHLGLTQGGFPHHPQRIKLVMQRWDGG